MSDIAPRVTDSRESTTARSRGKRWVLDPSGIASRYAREGLHEPFQKAVNKIRSIEHDNFESCLRCGSHFSEVRIYVVQVQVDGHVLSFVLKQKQSHASSNSTFEIHSCDVVQVETDPSGSTGIVHEAFFVPPVTATEALKEMAPRLSVSLECETAVGDDRIQEVQELRSRVGRLERKYAQLTDRKAEDLYAYLLTSIAGVASFFLAPLYLSELAFVSVAPRGALTAVMEIAQLWIAVASAAMSAIAIGVLLTMAAKAALALTMARVTKRRYRRDASIAFRLIGTSRTWPMSHVRAEIAPD